MKQRFHSIRLKLASIVLLTTLVALVVSLTVIVTYELNEYRRSFIADMATQAELLGRMTAPALSFDDPKLATENLNLLRIHSKVSAAAIYNARGELFATYGSTEFPRFPENDTIYMVGDNLILFERIEQDGNILGTVFLRADNEFSERIVQYVFLTGMIFGIAMLIAFFMLSRLERLVTRPILLIAETARDVMEQRDYSRRAQKISNDEVGTLVDAFNGMLAEIERRTSELESSNREIAREADKREQAQQEIMRLNLDLESRVHQRTAQLEIANKELELAKDVAEKANSAKSAFLSSMSHELRTPLNAVLGFAQLLASETIVSTSEQRKEFVDHILKAGRHLLMLINEVLDLAKIESGTLSLSLEPVALDEVMAECRSMVEPMGRRRTIRMVFPEKSGLFVFADRTRLKQVLLNLLSNAVKYNRETGSVVVECIKEAENRVHISVQDTGEGLGAEQLNALFQPFNRLGKEFSAEEGTGIGLVVTKRLVELMGGEIGVSSIVGQGSIFWVNLRATTAFNNPFTDGHGKTIEVPKRNADGTLPTLLYVEDNPANLKLVEEIIRCRNDLCLLSAPDGKLGVELAKVHQPDIILMDINLPGMNGNEVKKILHEDPITCDIPVIALTANAMPRDIARGHRAGFFRYITKPIDIDELNEVVNSALDFVERNRTDSAPDKDRS